MKGVKTKAIDCSYQQKSQLKKGIRVWLKNQSKVTDDRCAPHQRHVAYTYTGDQPSSTQ